MPGLSPRSSSSLGTRKNDRGHSKRKIQSVAERPTMACSDPGKKLESIAMVSRLMSGEYLGSLLIVNELIFKAQTDAAYNRFAALSPTEPAPGAGRATEFSPPRSEFNFRRKCSFVPSTSPKAETPSSTTRSAHGEGSGTPKADEDEDPSHFHKDRGDVSLLPPSTTWSCVKNDTISETPRLKRTPSERILISKKPNDDDLRLAGILMSFEPSLRSSRRDSDDKPSHPRNTSVELSIASPLCSTVSLEAQKIDGESNQKIHSSLPLPTPVPIAPPSSAANLIYQQSPFSAPPTGPDSPTQTSTPKRHTLAHFPKPPSPLAERMTTGGATLPDPHGKFQVRKTFPVDDPLMRESHNPALRFLGIAAEIAAVHAAINPNDTFAVPDMIAVPPCEPTTRRTGQRRPRTARKRIRDSHSIVNDERTNSEMEESDSKRTRVGTPGRWLEDLDFFGLEEGEGGDAEWEMVGTEREERSE
ncbi:hypothetical protein MMC21_005430 [Puttea exsequens]|nr:hypothetical protein [Puttea exsequens]